MMGKQWTQDGLYQCKYLGNRRKKQGTVKKWGTKETTLVYKPVANFYTKNGINLYIFWYVLETIFSVQYLLLKSIFKIHKSVKYFEI